MNKYTCFILVLLFLTSSCGNLFVEFKPVIRNADRKLVYQEFNMKEKDNLLLILECNEIEFKILDEKICVRKRDLKSKEYVWNLTTKMRNKVSLKRCSDLIKRKKDFLESEK